MFQLAVVNCKGTDLLSQLSIQVFEVLSPFLHGDLQITFYEALPQIPSRRKRCRRAVLI